MQHRLRDGLALIAIFACALATGNAVATAQTTPEPMPTATPAPVETMMPAATPVPAMTPVPGAPTPDANGITPLKQGGVNENSNGPNWLEKFNRKPGPDVNEMPPPAPVNAKKPRMKMKKVRAHPPG